MARQARDDDRAVSRGGGTDAFARPLAAQFAKQTGKQLVIDNKGGAGGTVGASIAARSAHDGYSVFMGAVHHTIAPSMYPKLDYDLEKDFVPLTLVASVPQVVVVNPRNIASPEFKAFLELMRKNPGNYNYGSAGTGTSHHLAGELFKQQTKTFVTHIPYRGAGPALQDLIAGQVDMMFDGLGSSATHIKGGRIKALDGVGQQAKPGSPGRALRRRGGPARLHRDHLVRHVGAQGHAGHAQARIVDEVRKAIQSDELKAIWASQGAEFPNFTPQQFGAFVNSEIKRWAAVVKASGAKLD